jgi:uncharacterized protein (UPF0332 family)
MTFDWEDYLRLAEALLRERSRLAPEEACLRSAISRAYYAAFASVRNFARQREGLFLGKSGSVHKSLVEHFKCSPDRVRKQVGNDLNRIRGCRASADYDDIFKDPRGPRSLLDAAEASLTWAREILKTLSSIP